MRAASVFHKNTILKSSPKGEGVNPIPLNYINFYVYTYLHKNVYNWKNMTKIITIIQQKGGSTKTTSCMNIAGALIEAGYKIKVADMNTEQQSASKWARRGEDFQSVVISVSEKQTRKNIETLSKDSDFILIDTPPELM